MTDKPTMKTLFLVGDSTVSDYALEPDRYYPRWGYGMAIGEYLLEGVRVNNLALPGRSSLSFLGEDNYKVLLDNLKKGDILLIGFGHNDQKLDERFTTPTADFTDKTSIGYTLKNFYIDLAKSRGAKVVLCTPISRRSLDNDYTKTCGHVTDAGDYRNAIFETGLKTGVDLIDMTLLTTALYLKWGLEKTKLLHATNDLDINNTDNTHLNSYGARVIAYTLIESVLKCEDSALYKLVDKDKFKPPVFEQTIITNA